MGRKKAMPMPGNRIGTQAGLISYVVLWEKR